MNTLTHRGYTGPPKGQGFFLKDGVRRIRDITDGTSNSIAVGETTHKIYTYGRWYAHWPPNVSNGTRRQDYQAIGRTTQFRINPPAFADAIVQSTGFHSEHVGGAQFLFGDGSVHFLSENIHHTARQWGPDPASISDPYDLANGGAGFGTYQRLGAIQDGFVVGEF